MSQETKILGGCASYALFLGVPCACCDSCHDDMDLDDSSQGDKR